MSKGSHDCRKHCRGCGHIVDLVAGECPVCEFVHYVDMDGNDVVPQKGSWSTIVEEMRNEKESKITIEEFNHLYLCTPVRPEE